MVLPIARSNKQTNATKISLLRPLRRYSGNISTTAVTTDSTCTNCESNPTMMIIQKNKADQSGAKGICAIAFGYAINTSPGPEEINLKINLNFRNLTSTGEFNFH